MTSDGWNWIGPSAEPPAGPVDDDAEPGHEHEQEQREGAQQQQPADLGREQRQAAALEHLHGDQADAPEHEVADELAGAAAALPLRTPSGEEAL